MPIKNLIALLAILSLTASAAAQQWRPLFDGHSLDGWVKQNGDPASVGAWQVVDGTLHLDRSQGPGGNLLSTREFGDFELVFEWRVSEKGNNGIKYRVRNFDGRTLGLEYQVIDDIGLPNLGPKHQTGSIYDIYEPVDHHLLRPAGEFNRGRIVVRGNRIDHWLNGCLITSATVGSAEWKSRIADSKFSDVEGFGRNACGRIMITDHKDEVWYHNIFIRELNCPRRTSAQFVQGCVKPANRRAARRCGGILRRLFSRR